MPGKNNSVPKVQRFVAILWPSFVVSGIATVLFFTAFDPDEVIGCVGGWDISRMGYYSVGFFLFWLLTSLNSVLTCYFLKPCSKS
ncbi:MAG: hypothetical protein OEY29_11360 [Gammaproteobacteria bacterium]|nr:hypothetical protein [Gammaproteobacteria bacterium]